MASKSGEKVTRISAQETVSKKVSKKPIKTPKALKAKKMSKAPKTPRVRKVPTNRFAKTLFAIGGYFKGAWIELRLVRWPTRSATWGLTFAVILFSVFFVVVILLLDILFKFVFELILK